MAYTRGMKRRGAPLPRWGAKRSRTRYSRRRNYRSKKSTAFSSQRGNTSMFGYRGRMMPRRRYKNLLWNASQIQEHHRSNITFTTAAGSAVLANQQQIHSFVMLSNSFWDASGGADILAPAIDSKIFIRGGMSTLRLKNSHTEVMNYQVWIIKTTSAGFPAFPVAADIAWDPTILNTDQRYFRIVRSFRFSIEAGDSNTLMHRIFSRRVDQTDFNSNSNREYWIVGINDWSNAATGSTDVFRSHNVSFTYDRFG